MTLFLSHDIQKQQSFNMAKEIECVSKITKNACQDSELYDFLSDFRNLATLLPEEAKEKLSFDQESISIQAAAGMSITLSLLEKEPYKLLKLGTPEKEMFRLWVQLKQVAAYDTRIRITLRADVPLMLRPMIKKDKLQEFVDNLALALSQIPSYVLNKGSNQSQQEV